MSVADVIADWIVAQSLGAVRWRASGGVRIAKPGTLFRSARRLIRVAANPKGYRLRPARLRNRVLLARWKAGENYRSLAAEYGVTPRHVEHVIRTGAR